MTFFGQPDYLQLLVEPVSQYFFQILKAVWSKKSAMTAAPTTDLPRRIIPTSLFFLEEECRQCKVFWTTTRDANIWYQCTVQPNNNAIKCIACGLHNTITFFGCKYIYVCLNAVLIFPSTVNENCQPEKMNHLLKGMCFHLTPLI